MLAGMDAQNALAELLSAEIYAYLLVVARVSGALMVMPGVGETFVSARVRIILVLLVAWPIAVVTPGLPAAPDHPGPMTLAIMAELFAGLLIGAGARILFMAARTAAQIGGQSMALSNVFAAPGMGDGGSVLTSWMTIGALAMWFATGLHLVAIDAIAQSYAAIPAGQFPAIGASAEAVTRVFASAFALGVQLGAPFLLLGFIAYFALGLVNRLMQSLPVFFIVMPTGILGGLWLFALVIGSVLTVFSGAARSWLEAPFS